MCACDYGIQLTVRQVLKDDQPLGSTTALSPSKSRHRRRQTRLHVSSDQRDMRVSTLIQKSWQSLSQPVETLVQLKTTEIERVFLALEKLFIDPVVPFGSLQVKRSTNQTRIAHAAFFSQHLLHSTAGHVDILRQPVLKCFQTLGRNRVEVSFDSLRIVPGWLKRRCPHDVCGLQ